MNQKTVQEESNDAIVPGTFGGDLGALPVHQTKNTLVIEDGRNSIIDGSQSGLSYNNTGPKTTITQMEDNTNQFVTGTDMSFNPSNLNAAVQKPSGP